MPEFLLDAKLWKKISESLEPSTQVFIHENKCSSPSKWLLPVVALDIDQKFVKIGDIYSQFVRSSGEFARTKKSVSDAQLDRKLFVGRNRGKLMQIERALLLECVRIGMVEAGVLHGGERLVVRNQSSILSPFGDSKQSAKEGVVQGYVYFVRNGDLFKIGITENLLRRMNELSPDELLNTVRCFNYQEVERELHRRFKDVRLPQTEYFRMSDAQVQEVHLLMMQLANFPQ